MASLVLGGIGAILGSLVGGPIGASIGYMIGSAIGTAFQKGNDGPKLENLKLANSQYGAPIPVPYGTKRYKGQIIWQTDLQPHAHKHGKGGSGGPTTYTYSASWAALLTDMSSGPAVAVPQIWFDGTLVYDETGANGNLPQLPMTIYLGTVTQSPDPVMEAILGVGNVPGYRRYCYLVFDDMDLTDYGNRLPSINASVATAAGVFPWRVSTFNWDPEGKVHLNAYGAVYDGKNVTVYIYNGGPPETYYEYVFDIYGVEDMSKRFSAPIVGGPGINQFVIQNCTGEATRTGWYYRENFTTSFFSDPLGGVGNQIAEQRPVYQNDFIYAIGRNGINGHTGISRWPATGAVIDGTSGVADGTIDFGAGFNLSDLTIATSNNSDVYVYNNVTGFLTAYTADLSGTIVNSWDMSGTNFYSGFVFTVFNNVFAGYNGTSKVGAYYLNNDGTVTFVNQIFMPIGSVIELGKSGLCLVPDGIISLVPPPAPVTLKAINDDISARCNCPAYDHSALADILVAGYSIDQQTIGRDCITPLQSAYFYDMVERAGVMTSVLQGGPSQVSIPSNDLACHAEGDTLPALIEIKYTQELELPYQVAVNYIDASVDYQTNTQYARREVTTSQLSLTAQLAIVLTASEAQAIATTSLYRAWTERSGLGIALPRKYWQYEPTDVVTAEGFLMRLTSKNDTVPGVVKFEGVAANRTLYSQGQAIGSSGDGFTPSTPPPTQTTTLLLLDIALVTDADSPNGIYGDFIPSAATFYSGGTLWKSIDGGANYVSIDASNTRAIVGIASGTLADFGGGNMFDESNTIEVVIGAAGGDLTSADETSVFAGANIAMLGSEIFQYKTADLTATNTYTLSGLLRGRRGTEWAMATHGAGEQFVAFPTSVNPPAPFNELGLSLKYKATSVGQAVAAVNAQDFTNNGNALAPYAPVQVGGAPIDPFDGTVQINWLRRTRIGGAWNNFNDVPLSEPSEQYIVQIWNAAYSLVARIIQVTSPTVTYTAAQQVTDFGATQLHVYATIGQLGSYTLGTQTRVTVDGLGASDDAPLNPVPPYNS